MHTSNASSWGEKSLSVSLSVTVTGGKLDLGPLEQIFYGEFDGQRPKHLLIKIIGE